YSGIPRALIAPGTPTVWPTSTTTRNEARAQPSEAAWLAPWARSPSTPAASRVIATTTHSFVAARIPIIPFASYRSGRKFPLTCSEIGYEVLILLHRGAVMAVLTTVVITLGQSGADRLKFNHLLTMRSPNRVRLGRESLAV